MRIEKQAYAKINLGLDVTEKRDDGYHIVRMIMQNVDLFDTLTFEDNDLYFAIHKADIEMKAEIDEESIWNINIKLSDTFDFTKFKMPDEYYNDAKSVPQSLLSSTLYNLAFISFKLGVIKEFKVIAELSFKVKDGEIIE